MPTMGTEKPVTAMCVFGGPVDDGGVCIEHGESVCVVTVPGNAPVA